MKLIGRDVSVDSVLAFVEQRLGSEARGEASSLPATPGVEPRVDPLTFNLEKLTEHADPTRGLSVESHRDGLQGRLVVLAKQVFRSVGQVFINEALGRQRLFNSHVRDSYAQLSSEVLRLRTRVAELEAARPSHDTTRSTSAAPKRSG